MLFKVIVDFSVDDEEWKWPEYLGESIEQGAKGFYGSAKVISIEEVK